MSLIKNHPRKALFALSLILFTAGFMWARVEEGGRIRTLVESTVQADRDINGLVSAYEGRLDTVRALVVHAKKHNLQVQEELMSAFEDITKPAVTDADALRQYLGRQIQLSRLTSDMIAQIDTDLPPNDPDFPKLFKEFQEEEESLNRLRESYREQTQRVRSIARKGDRQFIRSGLHLPEGARL